MSQQRSTRITMSPGHRPMFILRSSSWKNNTLVGVGWGGVGEAESLGQESDRMLYHFRTIAQYASGVSDHAWCRPSYNTPSQHSRLTRDFSSKCVVRKTRVDSQFKVVSVYLQVRFYGDPATIMLQLWCCI